MNSNFHVVRNYQEVNLLPASFAGLFIIAILSICFVLFPKQSINHKALTLNKPEKITQFYLEKLHVADPTNTAYQIALIQQTIGLHEWAVAMALINELNSQPGQGDQVARLSFIYAYEKAFQTPKGVSRESAIAKLKAQLPLLTKYSLNAGQLKQLGEIALKLESPQLALAFYQKVIALEGEQPPEFYIELSSVALQSSQYELAAHYAEVAALHEPLMELKRQYTITALKAYLAGNLFKDGAALLLKCDNELLNNKAMLIFVTQYALNINRPDLAETFIKRALLNNWGGL